MKVDLASLLHGQIRDVADFSADTPPSRCHSGSNAQSLKKFDAILSVTGVDNETSSERLAVTGKRSMKQRGVIGQPMKTKVTKRGGSKATVSIPVAYIDAIKREAPVLAAVFVPADPEISEKRIEERSTGELIALIDAGRFLNEIAGLWNVSVYELNLWILQDIGRSNRARAARKNQAALWDWVGLQVLLHAPSERIEITRAEKIAQHCRWRARAFGREDYGQAVKITQVNDTSGRELTTRELEIIARGDVLPG